MSKSVETKKKIIKDINEILEKCNIDTLNYLRLYALLLKEKAES